KSARWAHAEQVVATTASVATARRIVAIIMERERRGGWENFGKSCHSRQQCRFLKLQRRHSAGRSVFTQPAAEKGLALGPLKGEWIVATPLVERFRPPAKLGAQLKHLLASLDLENDLGARLEGAHRLRQLLPGVGP